MEVPPYRDASVCHPVKVNFYVINGKRKRSQPQHFTYTPLACKNAAQPLFGMLFSHTAFKELYLNDFRGIVLSHLTHFFPSSAPSIKTEPIDEYEAERMGFAMPQILGLSPHSYYHSPRGILHPDNGLVSGMAPCQRLSSSLPNQDARFQQQSPAIVYSRGGKSLSGSPAMWQTGGMMPDPHRSVLVHTGSPAQSVGPINAGQHPSIIQFSPTNHHLIRAGEPQPLTGPQPDNQQIIYCDSYSPQAAATHSPTPPQVAVTHPQHYPTVIQQQKGRTPAGTGQMDASADGQRRVTVKEENLDQAYLDDGECKLMLLYSV